MAQVMAGPVRTDTVREEMRRHRAALPKRPVHPGMTRAESGLTAAEAELLWAGVCDELATQTERGERWANWAMAGLSLVLLAFAAAQVLGWL